VFVSRAFSGPWRAGMSSELNEIEEGWEGRQRFRSQALTQYILVSSPLPLFLVQARVLDSAQLFYSHFCALFVLGGGLQSRSAVLYSDAHNWYTKNLTTGVTARAAEGADHGLHCS
jgi:hypothetical protein